MLRSRAVVVAVLCGATSGLALAPSGCTSASQNEQLLLDQALPATAAPVAALPPATVTVDARRGEMVIELPPVDVDPAAMGMDAMALTAVCRVDVPLSGALYRYRVEVVDSAGRPSQGIALHHLNVTDPSRRELFVPIALHFLAAGRETPALAVPRSLMGMPFRRGQVLIAAAMVTNAEPVPRTGIRVRLIVGYVLPGRSWPRYEAYPFGLDVLFPVGHPPAGSKAFDLPPGRTVRSWEARPVVPGTVVGVGGHLHDHAVDVQLVDVTAGRVLWRGTPVKDSLGHVLVLPPKRFFNLFRLGIHITPSHVYRITATYDNPTGRTLCSGGMGAAGGLFIPDRGARWPAVDTSDAAYRQDLHDTMDNDPHDMQAMMSMEHDC